MGTRVIVVINSYRINVESLCCIPETNMIFYVNYTSIKEKECPSDSSRLAKHLSYTRGFVLCAQTAAVIATCLDL